jgi:hypothetical protein
MTTTPKQIKPPREAIAAVNRASFELSRGHYPTIRARLLLAVTEGIAAGIDWRVALQSATNHKEIK